MKKNAHSNMLRGFWCMVRAQELKS